MAKLIIEGDDNKVKQIERELKYKAKSMGLTITYQEPKRKLKKVTTKEND